MPSYLKLEFCKKMRFSPKSQLLNLKSVKKKIQKSFLRFFLNMLNDLKAHFQNDSKTLFFAREQFLKAKKPKFRKFFDKMCSTQTWAFFADKCAEFYESPRRMETELRLRHSLKNAKIFTAVLDRSGDRWALLDIFSGAGVEKTVLLCPFSGSSAGSSAGEWRPSEDARMFSQLREGLGRKREGGTGKGRISVEEVEAIRIERNRSKFFSFFFVFRILLLFVYYLKKVYNITFAFSIGSFGA